MRRRAFLTFAILFLLAAMAPITQARPLGGTLRSLPGSMVPVYAGHTTDLYQPIPAPIQIRTAGARFNTLTPTATIDVTYHNFTSDAQAAFQAAVDVWESEIVSSQVIHVDASWTPLGTNTGILGEAGTTYIYLEGDHFWYPAALEEARCDCDANSGPEIQAEFNSDFNGWYYGTDGNVPFSKYDLFTVVLHELGHGLGFFSSFDVAGAYGYWGYSNGIANYPLRFDADEWSANTGGSQMISFKKGSSTLKSQLIDGSVYLDGTNLQAVLGHRAELYAPSPWEEGSSNSHLDENTFAPGSVDALMTPVLNNGESIHDPGAVTMAVFSDIGWTTAGSSPTAPGAPQNVAAVAGDGSADVSWNTPISDGGDAITGYTATSSPDGLTCGTSGVTSCTVSGLTNGTAYTFTVTATNSVDTGPPSAPSNSVIPHVPSGDVTPPSVGTPTANLVPSQVLGTTALVHVAWPGATDDSGIALYQLQRKKGTGAWVGVALATPTSTSADVPVVPGANYRFRVRATDGADNVGSWTTTTAAKLSLRQETDSSIGYSGLWKRSALSGASRGYVRRAALAGNTATLTFNGTSVAFVTTLASTRGIVQISLDGVDQPLVDLYSASKTTSFVAWATDSPLTAGVHTLEVSVTGTKNLNATNSRIDVDAFLVWP